MANGTPDLIALYCQRCGQRFPKDKLKDVKITDGQQKGLVLQLCPGCSSRYDRPNFMNRAIYK